ncbi:MAG: dihydropteroate synthase [Pseudomonadota bacterium]
MVNKLLLTSKTLVMGILNVTPDSFSDGGLYLDYDKAVAHGESLAADGADIIDVGGVSTRPFSEPVSQVEELNRVIPVIKKLSQRVSATISVDTFRAEVAAQAIASGAGMVNDIGSLRLDSQLGNVVAQADIPVVLMHMQGTPKTMQVNPIYCADVVKEILCFLSDSINLAIKTGIRKENIIVDPGIGFGKTIAHNLIIIKELERLQALGCPILIGASRKSFIGEVLGEKTPSQRDTGTMAVTAIAVMNGAKIVRVHDVKQTVNIVRMVEAIKTS